MLQCATTGFSVLQCVAVCCSANGPCHYGDTDQIIYISVLQHIAVRCSVAVDCSGLQGVEVCCSATAPSCHGFQKSALR